MLKIKNILISQPEPENGKSPYVNIASKYGVEVVFHPFIKVESYSLAEFLKQKINLSQFTSIVFITKKAIDNYFRLAKESKTKIVSETKYFCLNESLAFYTQKYIKFRKRKIFAAQSGRYEELFELLNRNNSENFLFILPENGNSNIDKELKESDITYSKAMMYRSVSNTFPKGYKYDHDMTIFFSPLGISSFMENFPNFEQGDKYFGCLGTSAAKAIKDAGFRLDLEVPNPQFSSISLAIEDFIQRNHKGSKK